MTAKRTVSGLLPTCLFVMGLGSCAMLGWPTEHEYLTAPDPAPIAPIEGPEDPHVLDGLHGWVLQVSGRDRSTVHAREIPSLREETIRTRFSVDELSGPDREGWLVYRNRKEGLHLVSIPMHEEREIPLATSGAFPHLDWFDISPDGGLLAVGLRASEDYELGDDVELHVLDVDSGEDRNLGRTQIVTGRWAADSRRMLVHRITIGPELGLDDRGREIRPEVEWSLAILDTTTGSMTSSIPGTEACLSADCARLVYRGPRGEPVLREMQTGAESALDVPGLLWQAKAWLGSDVVIYLARPTVGQEPGVDRFDHHYPIARCTLKAAKPSGIGFVTVSASVGTGDIFSAGVHAAAPR